MRDVKTEERGKSTSGKMRALISNLRAEERREDRKKRRKREKIKEEGEGPAPNSSMTCNLVLLILNIDTVKQDTSHEMSHEEER